MRQPLPLWLAVIVFVAALVLIVGIIWWRLSPPPPGEIGSPSSEGMGPPIEVQRQLQQLGAPPARGKLPTER